MSFTTRFEGMKTIAVTDVQGKGITQMKSNQTLTSIDGKTIDRSIVTEKQSDLA